MEPSSRSPGARRGGFAPVRRPSSGPKDQRRFISICIDPPPLSTLQGDPDRLVSGEARADPQAHEGRDGEPGEQAEEHELRDRHGQGGGARACRLDGGPELAEPINRHLDRLLEAMEPWAADGGYFNFAERSCDADAILPPETCARLAEVKRRWDPDGTIVANHEVSLASA